MRGNTTAATAPDEAFLANAAQSSDTMAGMPGRTRPPAQPPEIARLVEALANSVRTELLHVLANGSLTVAQLSDQTAIPSVSAWRNLKALEELGLVSSHEEPGHRGPRGVRVSWSINPEAVRRAANLWADYAGGSDKPAAPYAHIDGE